MKKFLAFVVLSSLLTFAVIALANATVLDAAPATPPLPGSHAPASQIPESLQAEPLPVTLV